jgi:hypothetical protein
MASVKNSCVPIVLTHVANVLSCPAVDPRHDRLRRWARPQSRLGIA